MFTIILNNYVKMSSNFISYMTKTPSLGVLRKIFYLDRLCQVKNCVRGIPDLEIKSIPKPVVQKIALLIVKIEPNN